MARAKNGWEILWSLAERETLLPNSVCKEAEKQRNTNLLYYGFELCIRNTFPLERKGCHVLTIKRPWTKCYMLQTVLRLMV